MRLIRKKYMRKIILGLSLFSMTMFFGSMIPLNTSNVMDNFITLDNVSDQVTVKRKLGNFDQIKASSAVSIKLVDGNYNGEITITATAETLENLNTTVTNNTLEINRGSKGKFGFRSKNSGSVEITIPHRKLRSLKLSGASNLTAKHTLKVEEFKVDLSGASNANLNLLANRIEIDLSGASKVDLSGNVQNLNLDLSGASNFNGMNLKASEINFDASGASTLKIWAVNSLKGSASGASSVKYKEVGSLNKDVSTSGASSVKSYN